MNIKRNTHVDCGPCALKPSNRTVVCEMKKKTSWFTAANLRSTPCVDDIPTSAPRRRRPPVTAAGTAPVWCCNYVARTSGLKPSRLYIIIIMVRARLLFSPRAPDTIFLRYNITIIVFNRRFTIFGALTAVYIINTTYRRTTL